MPTVDPSTVTPGYAGVEYDPWSPDHRVALADALLASFDAAGFHAHLAAGPGSEVVLTRRHGRHDRAMVHVYSTVEDGRARPLDADAIRVVAIFVREDGKGVPLHQAKVLRTGLIAGTSGRKSGIVDRTLYAARDAYGALYALGACSHCGAPLARSKASKVYCADACWTRKAGPQ